MSKHRLLATMPASGVVFVAANGDIDHVARGTLGITGRSVDTGNAWQTREGQE